MTNATTYDHFLYYRHLFYFSSNLKQTTTPSLQNWVINLAIGLEVGLGISFTALAISFVSRIAKSLLLSGLRNQNPHLLIRMDNATWNWEGVRGQEDGSEEKKACKAVGNK